MTVSVRVIMSSKTKCIHFFILPTPDGRESIGVCKHCKLEQVHYNSIETKFNSWRGKNDDGRNIGKVK